MKALILVDQVSSVPAKHRDRLYVITGQNWQESILFFQGKSEDQYVYLHESAPAERLLKLIEEYQGNLAVYTPLAVDSVMLSRFTSIVNRRKVEIKDLTPANSLLDKVSKIKQML